MQEKISLSFKNCYGIGSLDHTFDFSNNNMPVAVYAPNGAMKTSFAKSLRDYSEGKQPKDIIFPEKETKLSIVDQDGALVEPDSIFVIDSINEKYKSDRISTLLASEDLKNEYDTIFGSIGKKRDDLFKVLKKYSGLSKDIEIQFAEAFSIDSASILIALARLDREVKKGANSEFSGLKYKIIFSEKVLEFLKNSDVENLIDQYTQAYEQILDKSRYFKKGVFNHSNAEVIAKNLKANGWFDGGHSVNLNNGGDQKIISTEAELVNAIESEKEQILTDPKLTEMFSKVEKAISTTELRTFRDYLISNPFVVAELKDIPAFKQKVWISYLVEIKSDYLVLVEEFDRSEERIAEIIAAADSEQTRWEQVIELFNSRFSVPFEVRIENKSDAILNRNAPQLTFYFKDDDQTKRTDRGDLDKVLSTGERRALYILNIIFEVQGREADGIETFFVFDDIADSFDYKNKYAIVEYLHDIKSNDKFHVILLSHNFDFYRTIRSRLGIYGDNKLLANRTNGKISLVTDTLSENPFNQWRNRLSENEVLIASIPFVRNLAEYSGNDAEFNALTKLLHIKPGTEDITLEELNTSYGNVLKQGSFQDFSDSGRTVLSTVFEICDVLREQDGEEISLEGKIALAIGIRLKTEELLIEKINDNDFVASLQKNQTTKLIKRYQRGPNVDAAIMKTVQKVVLMTPENIHLNSFMYEPILDMSGHHLKSLYSEIFGH